MVKAVSRRSGQHGKSVRHSTVDEKGRVLIPEAFRKQLGIESGDVLFVQVESPGVLRYARAENPFDILAEHALRDSRAGRTIRLRDFAEEEGIDLDSE